MYIDDGERVPLPALPGQMTVTLPAQTAAKVLLWNGMLDQQLTKAELARRMQLSMPEVTRLFDLAHSTGIDQIEKAARILGKRFEFRVEEYLDAEGSLPS
jgi:antitoxin HicB